MGPGVVHNGVPKWGILGVCPGGLKPYVLMIWGMVKSMGYPEIDQFGVQNGSEQVWTVSAQNIHFWNIPVSALWGYPEEVRRGRRCPKGVQKGSQIGVQRGVPNGSIYGASRAHSLLRQGRSGISGGVKSRVPRNPPDGQNGQFRPRTDLDRSNLTQNGPESPEFTLSLLVEGSGRGLKGPKMAYFGGLYLGWPRGGP